MSYKAPFVTCGLAEAIARQNAVPVLDQPRLIEIDKAICWFCLIEKGLPVRVNSHAEAEGRFVIIEEKQNGKCVDVVWGVCSPCAEKRGMVYRDPENDN